MDDLRTILDGLEDAKLDYVLERSKCRTDSEAIRKAGVGRSTFYHWKDREQLSQYAQQLKRRRKTLAELHLEEAAEKAAQVKVEGLKSLKEHIQQAAATEILDRTIGRPTQKVEADITSGGAFDLVAWRASQKDYLSELEEFIERIDSKGNDDQRD